jgi:hypothetical protein
MTERHYRFVEQHGSLIDPQILELCDQVRGGELLPEVADVMADAVRARRYATPVESEADTPKGDTGVDLASYNFQVSDPREDRTREGEG